MIGKGVYSTGGMILTGKLKHSHENLSQCHFVHQKSNLDWYGTETGLPRANNPENVTTNDRTTNLRPISMKNERNYVGLELWVYPALVMELTNNPSGLAMCRFHRLFNHLFVCMVPCYVMQSCATCRVNSVASSSTV
jgi:hypothetical protein